MTRKKKISIVLFLLFSAGIMAVILLKGKSKRYEDMYPWMAGWSNEKKEYFKQYRFRAITNWHMGAGGNYSQSEAEAKARQFFDSGIETIAGEWDNLWSKYRELRGLNENGF